MNNHSKFLLDGPSEEEILKGIQRAIDLERKSGKVDKDIINGDHPKVGCVILDKDGNIISESYTREEGYGKTHAEVIAIKKLEKDRKLKNAHTLITTLEPCSSRNLDKHGNELSCAKAILKTNIKQVIIGMLDPVPVVRGHGIYILQVHQLISPINVLFFPVKYMQEVMIDNFKYIYKVTRQSPDYWKDKITIDEFHMMYTLKDIHCKLMDKFDWLNDALEEWKRKLSEDDLSLDDYEALIYSYDLYNKIERKIGKKIIKRIEDYRGLSRKFPQEILNYINTIVPDKPDKSRDFLKNQMKIQILLAIIEWYEWFKSQPSINRCFK